jgi:hypothetical protein
MSEQVITLRTHKAWLSKDGIIRFELLPDAEETDADAVAAIAAAAKLSPGVKRPSLVDLRAVRSTSRGARAYYAGPEPLKVFTATALWIDSPISKIIGNFFLGLNKPMIPFRLFTTEKEALAWLKDFPENPSR